MKRKKQAVSPQPSAVSKSKKTTTAAYSKGDFAATRDPNDLPPVPAPATPPRRPTALISPDLLEPTKPTPSSRSERIFRIKLHSDNANAPEDFVSDLLTDTRHYCDEYGIDFAHQDAIAYQHYIEEDGQRQEFPGGTIPGMKIPNFNRANRAHVEESNAAPATSVYRFSDGNTYTDYPTLAEAEAARHAQNGGTITPMLTGTWALEIKYLSAEKKARTGWCVLRDPLGEYAGAVPDSYAPIIVAALNAAAPPAPIAGGLDQDSPETEAYRAAAKKEHVREGTLEIDSNATVSQSDDGGAYVAAWVWVNDDDAEICRTCRTNSTADGEGYDGECGDCADKRTEEQTAPDA